MQRLTHFQTSCAYCETKAGCYDNSICDSIPQITVLVIHPTQGIPGGLVCERCAQVLTRCPLSQFVTAHDVRLSEAHRLAWYEQRSWYVQLRQIFQSVKYDRRDAEQQEELYSNFADL